MANNSAWWQMFRNMLQRKSQGIWDFSAKQQLQDSKRTEPSPPPPGLPACLHMSQWTEHPLVFKTPNRWRFSSEVKWDRSDSLRRAAYHRSALFLSHVRLRSSELTCVTSLLQQRQNCLLPALISPSSSIHLHLSPWLLSSWRRSPHRALSDASGRMPLSRGAQTAGSGQTDGRTDRQTEAEIASGLSNSASPSRTLAPLISISLSLTHPLGPSRPLLFSFSPIKSLLPVCISSRSRCGALTRLFSLTHLASLLFFSFHPTNSSTYVLVLCFLFFLFPPHTLRSISTEVSERLRNPVLLNFVGQCIFF